MGRHGRRAALWALMILVLCLIPGKDLPEWHWFDLLDLDKAVHFALFAVQAVLTALAFHPLTPRTTERAKAWGWAFATCEVYGGLLEVMQGALLMGRTADITDFVANTLGCVAGLVYLHRRAAKAGSASARTDP